MRFECPFCQRAYRIAAESLPHGRRATMMCAVCHGRVDLQRGDGASVVCLPERKPRSTVTPLPVEPAPAVQPVPAAQLAPPVQPTPAVQPAPRVRPAMPVQPPFAGPVEQETQEPVATIPRALQLFPQGGLMPPVFRPASEPHAPVPAAAASAPMRAAAVLARLAAGVPAPAPAQKAELRQPKPQIGPEFSVLFRLDRRSRRQGQMIGALTAVLFLALGGFGYWQVRGLRAAQPVRDVVRIVQPVLNQGPSAFARCVDIMDLAGETAARYSVPPRPAPAPARAPARGPSAPDSNASTPAAGAGAQLAIARSDGSMQRGPAPAPRIRPPDASRRQAKLLPPSTKPSFVPRPLPVLRPYRLPQPGPIHGAPTVGRSDGTDLGRSAAMNR